MTPEIEILSSPARDYEVVKRTLAFIHEIQKRRLLIDIGLNGSRKHPRPRSVHSRGQCIKPSDHFLGQASGNNGRRHPLYINDVYI